MSPTMAAVTIGKCRQSSLAPSIEFSLVFAGFLKCHLKNADNNLLCSYLWETTIPVSLEG